MAKVCRDLPFRKPFDLVSTVHYIPVGSIEFKDLIRTELPDSLNQADIDGLGISVLADLRLPVFPP